MGGPRSVCSVVPVRTLLSVRSRPQFCGRFLPVVAVLGFLCFVFFSLPSPSPRAISAREGLVSVTQVDRLSVEDTPLVAGSGLALCSESRTG